MPCVLFDCCTRTHALRHTNEKAIVLAVVPDSILPKALHSQNRMGYLKQTTNIYHRNRWMVKFSFSFRVFICFTLMRGYCNGGKSGNNAIDVVRVITVVEVAITVDIIEVRGVGDVGRPLPPVVRRNPTADNNQQPTSDDIELNRCILKLLL